jgi:hypothetical protein
MVQNPERIRRLTRSYHSLRGYEQIPFGLWAITPHVFDREGPGYLLMFLLVSAVTFAATHAIKRYYDRRFGVVSTPGGTGWRVVVVGLLGFFALQFVSNSLGLRVQLGFLAVGVAVAVYALRRFELQWQKLLVAVFLMIISVWPPITGPLGPSELWSNVFAIGFPLVWIAMSIRDHRTLMRTFESIRLVQPNGAP